MGVRPLFTVHLDRTGHAAPGLSPGLREAYGGDLTFPDPPPGRPYVFTNFVATLDGVAVLGVEQGSEGRVISYGSADDQWLMGLLRGAADAVLVAAGTARAEPPHTWAARALRHADAAAIEEWRISQGRPLHPIQCFVSASGSFPEEMAVFGRDDLRVIIYTTRAGERSTTRLRDRGADVRVFERDSRVDLTAVLRDLKETAGVGYLLCEGGPSLFGQMLALRLVDECFHTVSPRLAGLGDAQSRRPLTGSQTWPPQETPRLQLLSLRTGIRDPDHLFLRYRVLNRDP
jgi:riboflavin biosynthesis pyrimidine reductase